MPLFPSHLGWFTISYSAPPLSFPLILITKNGGHLLLITAHDPFQ